MDSNNKLPKPIRVVVYQGELKIFERVFLHYPIVFGRSPSSHIPLEFEFFSRSHGMLTLEAGQWVVSDLKSANGIYFNGERVEKVLFTDVTEVCVGKVRLQFEFMEQPAAVAYNPDDEVTAPTIMVPTSPSAPDSPIFQKSTAKSVDPQKEVRLAVPKPTPAVQKVVVPPIPKPALSGQPQTPPIPTPVANGKPAVVPVPVVPLTSIPIAVPRSETRSGEFYQVHPDIARGQAKKKIIEATVTWHDQVYDVHQYRRREKVLIGGLDASLACPVVRQNFSIAKVGKDKTVCFIPQGHQVTVRRGDKVVPMGDLIAQKSLQQNDFGYALKLDFTDVASVNMGSGAQVHLRYIPAPKEIIPNSLLYLEKAMRIAVRMSTTLHLVLMFILIMSPRPPSSIKLKNVPDRYARLLVDKPKPKPTPLPPPKKEEPPKVAKQKPPPKPKVVPKKIVVHPPKQPPKVIAKANKYPMTVKNPVKQAPPPVKVEQLGALAALGAISKSAPSNQVTNININKDAGGLQTKVNTGGIIGALPSTNGTLVAGGSGVKTKGGKGFGTGSGYGMQGLKGSAGGRGVAGAIVGEPKLAQAAKPEGLTRGQVMNVVKKYLGEIQSCYERSLLQDPSLRGRMEFEWDINPSGGVVGVRVKRSAIQNGDALGECVKGIFSQMKFPNATNGQWTQPSIGFPFGTM